MSSQSWTSWLLDAYASSVQSGSTDNPNSIAEDATNTEHITSASPISSCSASSHARSSSTSASSPTSSSYPFGPYLKSGRGGAGNFIWQSDLQPEHDVEAQKQQRQSSLSERQRAAALSEHIETSAAVEAKWARRKPEFLRVGVGGAGNLAITQSNKVQSPRSPSFPKTPTSTSVVTTQGAGYGRGGVGNYAAAAEVNQKAIEDKQAGEGLSARKTREDVEAVVDEMLKMPEGALIKEGREKDP